MRYRVAGGPAVQVGDELMLLSTSKSAYYSLNATAAFVWNGLNEGRPVEDLAVSLAERYNLPVNEAARDVAALLTDLEAHGLVKSLSTSE